MQELSGHQATRTRPRQADGRWGARTLSPTARGGRPHERSPSSSWLALPSQTPDPGPARPPQKARRPEAHFRSSPSPPSAPWPAFCSPSAPATGSAPQLASRPRVLVEGAPGPPAEAFGWFLSDPSDPGAGGTRRGYLPRAHTGQGLERLDPPPHSQRGLLAGAKGRGRSLVARGGFAAGLLCPAGPNKGPPVGTEGQAPGAARLASGPLLRPAQPGPRGPWVAMVKGSSPT